MQGLKHSIDTVLRILKTLYAHTMKGEAPTGLDLTRELGLTYSTFLRYIQVLTDYGLVNVKRIGNRNQYTLTLKGLKLVECIEALD